MRVRALRHCDARFAGQVKPLFEGQFYELPDETAAALIAEGAVAPVETATARAESKMVRPVRDKAMEGPAAE